MVSVDAKQRSKLRSCVWKSWWTSWAPVPNKPTVSVDVKHHSTKQDTKRQIDAVSTLRSRPVLLYVHGGPLWTQLQALVYSILPPATAIVDYAIGLEKLSACEQFFDDAQIAASW